MQKVGALAVMLVFVMSVAAESPITVAAYCQDFARTFCDQEALTYQEQSVRVTPLSVVMRWLSNMFQPADSTFTAGYQCAFRAQTRDGQMQSVAVHLLLTKTAHFAEFTHWEGLQIIPITYVVDEATGRAGYGVFKYLEQETEFPSFRCP